MARPKAPEYDDRRQAIIDCAARLFARDGFHKASLNDIAAECNVSKANLYHYFASKEAILFAVMRDHISLLLKTAEDVASLDMDAEERLRTLARRFMALYADAGDRHKVLLAELNSLSEIERKAIVKDENRVVDAVLSIIQEARPAAVADPRRAKPLTMAFMAMLNWTHTWFQSAGPVSAGEYADMVTDLFLNGNPESLTPGAVQQACTPHHQG